MRTPLRLLLTIPALCGSITLMSGCLAPRPEPPRRHECPSESLLVDVSVFPEGTTASSPLTSLPDGGGTSIAVEIGSDDISVSQAVYPYRTPQGAVGRFGDALDGIDKRYVGMPSIDLSQLALDADQYVFRCSDTETHPRCFYLARYDNFYIELILRTRSLDTPVDVLIPAIQDIDGRLMKCFEEHPAP